jgi:hypothetical protein
MAVMPGLGNHTFSPWIHRSADLHVSNGGLYHRDLRRADNLCLLDVVSRLL